jgi:EthD domain
VDYKMASSPGPDDTFQIVAFLSRNPNKTLLQFYDHWQNVHGPKVAPWAEKHDGILGYKQVRRQFQVPYVLSPSSEQPQFGFSTSKPNPNINLHPSSITPAQYSPIEMHRP